VVPFAASRGGTTEAGPAGGGRLVLLERNADGLGAPCGMSEAVGSPRMRGRPRKSVVWSVRGGPRGRFVRPRERRRVQQLGAQ
jgi:hypothetical protein